MTDEHFLRFVPRDFVHAYDELLDRSYAWGESGSNGRNAPQETGTGRPTGGLRATRSGTTERNLKAATAGAGKSGSSRDVILSEHALAFKNKMDRKIRKLTREIRYWLERGETHATMRKCTNARCRRYAEENWYYCPSCGYRTEGIDKR